MHFYVINPTLCYISKVTGKPSLEQMYEIIGCERIDAARLQGTSDVLICDDEGLFKNNDHLSISQLYVKGIGERILAGTCIYIGTSPQGESIEPEHTFQFPYMDETGRVKLGEADDDLAAITGITPQLLLGDKYMTMSFILRDNEGIPEIPTYTITEYIKYQHEINQQASADRENSDSFTEKILGLSSRVQEAFQKR